MVSSAKESNGVPAASVEMETFLPKDGSDIKVNGRYEVTRKDPEAGDPLNKDAFDPFQERTLANPTTDCDTLTHLLKACLGTGILSMPIAFKNSGLYIGVFATIFVAIICTHCSYVVVTCAHELYKRARVTSMSFADVAETAFANGPKWGRKFANPARIAILVGLFVTYFGTCSVYTVIIAKSFEQVFQLHIKDYNIDLRILIAAFLIPLILLSWIPNLKYLAPVSMAANVFMCTGLGITIYYLVTPHDDKVVIEEVAPLSNWPQFFSITIFAMEAIGVVMPLENNMKTPRHFVGICGVLNQGMSGVTLIYILLGFLGYSRYGELTADTITLNLPTKEIPAQTAIILIALAVFCTYGLQFYVCFEIVWNGIKERFPSHPLIANYILRTVLVALSVILAIIVPTIAPFIGLIGAFCFSILGLLFPVFIETVTYWDQGFGPYNWRVWKNVLVVVFGLLALGFGSASAMKEIIDLYK